MSCRRRRLGGSQWPPGCAKSRASKNPSPSPSTMSNEHFSHVILFLLSSTHPVTILWREARGGKATGEKDHCCSGRRSTARRDAWVIKSDCFGADSTPSHLSLSPWSTSSSQTNKDMTFALHIQVVLGITICDSVITIATWLGVLGAYPSLVGRFYSAGGGVCLQCQSDQVILLIKSILPLDTKFPPG